MERTRKQIAKSLDHKCDDCGIIVLGNIGKLKIHVVRYHSAMKHPKICKDCGNSSHPKCGSMEINHKGLKELQKYMEYKQTRLAEVNKEFNDKKLDKKLKGHIESYIQFTNLSCNICEIVGFNSSAGVSRHIETVHGPQNKLFCYSKSCSNVVFKC